MNNKIKRVIIILAFIVFIICMFIGAYIAKNGTS